MKVEDERRAKILGALNGAEAIKDQWMHKSTFQLPTISGTFFASLAGKSIIDCIRIIFILPFALLGN